MLWLLVGILAGPQAALADTIKIVALGASDTEGPFVKETETYPAQLQVALRAAGYDVSVVNAGRNGDTTDFIRRRAPDATADAQVVIYQPGGNDQLGGKRQGKVKLDPSQTDANIDETVRNLRAWRIFVLMFQYETGAGRDTAERYGAVFLGGFHEGVPPSAHLADGHMNGEGYGMLVRRIVPQVKAALDQLKH